jgi:predicted Zn-dependent protease
MKNILRKSAMRFKFVIICLSFISFSSLANGYIIDSEIQDAVNQIAHPIFKAANLKRPQIFVINNPSPNAFTDGNENIYIHSALIYKFPDPNILRGVIAHEVGHIKAGHVSRNISNFHKSKSIVVSSFILGVLSSVATGSAEFMMHSMAAGSDVAEKSFLRHSREYETAADIKAVELLKKTGHSSKGLINLLEHLHHSSNLSGIDQYSLTHPISLERIRLINSLDQSKTDTIEASLKTKYQMAAAKLKAYTSSDRDYTDYSKESKIYADSIIYMKKSDINNAIKSIDSLLKENPNNPYLHQTKAEILMSFGKVKAIEHYKIAMQLSNDFLLKTENAIAQIILLSDKTVVKKAVSFLEMNFDSFKNNTTIINYLSLGHSKITNSSNSMYYRALAKMLEGDLKLAKKLASNALRMNGVSKELSLKLNDIINFIE